MTADLVINPNARRLQRDPAIVTALTRAAGDRCRVHVTSDLQQLDALCADLATRSSLVLLAGGDGSLMAGVSALARHVSSSAQDLSAQDLSAQGLSAQGLPPVAPISVGTAGTVARNWGAHGQPLRRLRRLLNGSRRFVKRPTLRVQTFAPAGHNSHLERAGVESEHIGFIFGTGLVARFFELYNARGAPGYSGAAKMVARIFAESFVAGPLAARVLTPLPCKLATDGTQHAPDAWSLICASVVPNLGIGMRLNYRAAEDPLRPHLVASPLPPRELGPRAPRVLAGKPLGGPHNIDQLNKSFEVTFPERGPFVLDGELLEAHRVSVSAGPLLSVAVPA